MFAKPRPKKSILPPPFKKRKTSAIEEISFDTDARQEYLTGFHKRKQQRIKHAQEEAAKKARQERIDTRRLAREDRKREVEEHVRIVNKMLQESGAIDAPEEKEGSNEDDEEWEGLPDQPDLDIVDHEEEYIDEDRYTTVTVETVSVSRDGLEKPMIRKDSDDGEEKDQDEEDKKAAESKAPVKPKQKKKKFRYENKFDRQMADKKNRVRNRMKRE